MAAAKHQDIVSTVRNENKWSWRSPLVRAVLLAQLLSLLLCVMGTTSGLLAAHGVNMPTTQAVLNYLLLGLTCGGYHLWTRGPRLTNPWSTYLLLAVLDVEANFIVTKAYQYTSVTSVTLLDCFTIPSVMFLSALALRARYLPAHYGGAALCVAGLAVLVVTDRASETGGPNPMLGDALVLMGSVLYACSNVTQERLLLGATPVTELLAALGGFGAALGALQAILLERSAWLAADWSDPWVVAAPLAGFALALYSFSLLLPLVLMWSGATVLNLSLLTSDLWAAGSRVVFFGGFGGTAWWFVLSVVCEAAGLVLYTRAGQTHPHPDSTALHSGVRVNGGTGAGGGDDPWVGGLERGGEVGQPGAEEQASLLSGGSGLGGFKAVCSGNSSSNLAGGLRAVPDSDDGGRARAGWHNGSMARTYGVHGTEEERQGLMGLGGVEGESSSGGGSGGNGGGDGAGVDRV